MNYRANHPNLGTEDYINFDANARNSAKAKRKQNLFMKNEDIIRSQFRDKAIRVGSLEDRI